MSKEIVLKVRDDISEKILFFTCFRFISSLWCLSLSNKSLLITSQWNCVTDVIYNLFYHIFLNANNIKIYRHIDRKK